MPDPSSDNRRSGGRRKQPIQDIRVFATCNGDFLGNIIDLSVTGMSLECDLENPAKGRQVKLKLESTDDGEAKAEVVATVRWIEPGAHDGFHKLGFEFDHKLAEEDAAVIARLAVLHSR